MAKEPQPAYEPDKNYEVSLLMPVTRKGRTLSAMHRHTMTGKVLSEIPPEAIANVQPL